MPEVPTETLDEILRDSGGDYFFELDDDSTFTIFENKSGEITLILSDMQDLSFVIPRQYAQLFIYWVESFDDDDPLNIDMILGYLERLKLLPEDKNEIKRKISGNVEYYSES